MKNTGVFLLFLFTNIQNSFAVSVGSDVQIGAPPQACRMDVRAPKMGLNDYMPFCSGTVVHEKKILSAAHCALMAQEYLKADPGAQFQAKCHSVVTKQSNGSMSVAYKETFDIDPKKVWMHGAFKPEQAVTPGDVALFELSTAAKVPPMAITSPANIFDLKTGKFDSTKYNCFSSGFGVNETKGTGFPLTYPLNNNNPIDNPTKDFLDKGFPLFSIHKITVDPKKFNADNLKVLKTLIEKEKNTPKDKVNYSTIFALYMIHLNREQLVKQVSLTGDSGGALHCVEKQTGKSVLIAVNGTSHFPDREKFQDAIMSESVVEIKYATQFASMNFMLNAKGELVDFNGKPLPTTPPANSGTENQVQKNSSGRIN